MSIGLIFGILAVGLVVVVVGVVVSRRRGSAFIEERLGISEEKPEAEGEKERKAPVGEALDKALAKRGIGANLATQLARANLKVTVGEFFAATFILVVFAGVVSYIVKKDIIVTLVACVVGFFGPRVYVGTLRGRRLKSFNDQLGDTINLMVNGIRAGYSVMQAMGAVSREMGPPASEEFGRVVQEVQLGLTLEEGLLNMLRRVPSEDLDMMITAINVQREVGGNLAEVLDSISFTIRERIRIKGDIQALTAYGRGAGTLLSVVPIILAGIVYLITPEFTGLLFTDICGQIMVGIAILGIILGYVVIRKIVDIEV